jgi:hypothetical protein
MMEKMKTLLLHGNWDDLGPPLPGGEERPLPGGEEPPSVSFSDCMRKCREIRKRKKESGEKAGKERPTVLVEIGNGTFTVVDYELPSWMEAIYQGEYVVVEASTLDMEIERAGCESNCARVSTDP